MKKLKCLMGFHKITQREIHITKPLTEPVFSAAIITKCDRCDYSNVTSDMSTVIMLPEKYDTRD